MHTKEDPYTFDLAVLVSNLGNVEGTKYRIECLIQRKIILRQNATGYSSDPLGDYPLRALIGSGVSRS
jgi:hypothetical protein